MAARRGERFVRWSPWLFGVSVFYLALVVAWVYVPSFGAFLNHQMARLGGWGAPFHLVSHDKTFVALPRLLHVLAIAYVLSSLGVVHRLCGQRWAEPLRLMGRQGLLVFAAGTVMSLAFQVLMAGQGEPVWMAWVLPPLGIAASVALAWIAEWQRRPVVPAVTPSEAPAPGGWGSARRHPAE